MKAATIFALLVSMAYIVAGVLVLTEVLIPTRWWVGIILLTLGVVTFLSVATKERP